LEGEVAAAGDQRKGWSGWLSIYFVHLAHCAAFDIGYDKVLYVWPPVMSLYELYGFRNSRVSSSFQSVKMVEYPPPKIVVFHNNEGVSFPQVVLVI